MSDAKACDAIVVGGGIVGTTAAFFLRRRGLSVALLERRLCGQEASGVNYGNIRRQARPILQLPLANRAYDIWARLPELLGEDCEFLPAGHVRIGYSEEREQVFREYARDAADMGLGLEVLSGRQVRERFPYLSEEVVAVSFAPRDGHANPRLAAPAFARAARAAGVDVRENTPVKGITKSGEDFRVATAAGEWRAPMVLLATGAWSLPLCESLGETAPLTVHSPQMGVTEPTNYRIGPGHDVSTTWKPESIYFRQVKRGNIVFGGCATGPADPVAGRARVLPESTLLQFQQLRRLAPALGRLNLIRVWGGIESYLPDSLPIVGPSPRWPGLFYAFGFCGHGFQTGPGVGDSMAELMVTGATSTPLDAYSMARFPAAA